MAPFFMRTAPAVIASVAKQSSGVRDDSIGEPRRPASARLRIVKDAGPRPRYDRRQVAFVPKTVC